MSCRGQAFIPFREIGGHSGMDILWLLASQLSIWREPGGLSFITNKSRASHCPPSGLNFLLTGSMLVIPASLGAELRGKSAAWETSLLGDEAWVSRCGKGFTLPGKPGCHDSIAMLPANLGTSTERFQCTSLGLR